jgi:hypothetical protein
VTPTIRSLLRQSHYIKEKYIISNLLKLLSEFLRGPQDFFQDERRQRIVIISLFSLLFVCILFSVTNGTARRRNTSADPDVTSTRMVPAPTQTKWWVRQEPSETPTSLLPSFQTLIVDTETSKALNKCPAYASDFKPGTFGYISLFPPYENLVRSGPGKNHTAIGFIEIGGWVRILAEPVCADDGYVWLNVESAANSSNWTAGGHKTAQWVIPCPDLNKKCSKTKPVESISATPDPNNNGNNNAKGNNPNVCVSDKLAVGLESQVSPNDLLVVRSEPFIGSVLGRIAPLSIIKILDGPKCTDGAIWWKVEGPPIGWAVENSLRACPKEGECDPWRDERLLQ